MRSPMVRASARVRGSGAEGRRRACVRRAAPRSSASPGRAPAQQAGLGSDHGLERRERARLRRRDCLVALEILRRRLRRGGGAPSTNALRLVLAHRLDGETGRRAGTPPRSCDQATGSASRSSKRVTSVGTPDEVAERSAQVALPEREREGLPEVCCAPRARRRPRAGSGGRGSRRVRCRAPASRTGGRASCAGPSRPTAPSGRSSGRARQPPPSAARAPGRPPSPARARTGQVQSQPKRVQEAVVEDRQRLALPVSARIVRLRRRQVVVDAGRDAEEVHEPRGGGRPAPVHPEDEDAETHRASLFSTGSLQIGTRRRRVELRPALDGLGLRDESGVHQDPVRACPARWRPRDGGEAVDQPTRGPVDDLLADAVEPAAV